LPGVSPPLDRSLGAFYVDLIDAANEAIGVANATSLILALLHDPTIASNPDAGMNDWIRRNTAMNSLKIIIVAAALSTLSGYAQAETLKPLQGISFHAGSKDAVAYFLSENGTCKFVLTSADRDAQPIRIEAAISGGASSRYQLAEGNSLEVACQGDAQAMTISAQSTFAAN
jgi:hypothetical protein